MPKRWKKNNKPKSSVRNLPFKKIRRERNLLLKSIGKNWWLLLWKRNKEPNNRNWERNLKNKKRRNELQLNWNWLSKSEKKGKKRKKPKKFLINKKLSSKQIEKRQDSKRCSDKKRRICRKWNKLRNNRRQNLSLLFQRRMLRRSKIPRHFNWKIEPSTNLLTSHENQYKLSLNWNLELEVSHQEHLISHLHKLTKLQKRKENQL